MTKRRPSSPINEQACSRRRVRSSSVGDLFVHSVSEGRQVNSLHPQTGVIQPLSDQQPASTCATDTSWTNTHIFQQSDRRQQVQEKQQTCLKASTSQETQQMQQCEEGREVEEPGGEGVHAPPPHTSASTPTTPVLTSTSESPHSTTFIASFNASVKNSTTAQSVSAAQGHEHITTSITPSASCCVPSTSDQVPTIPPSAILTTPTTSSLPPSHTSTTTLAPTHTPTTNTEHAHALSTAPTPAHIPSSTGLVPSQVPITASSPASALTSSPTPAPTADRSPGRKGTSQEKSGEERPVVRLLVLGGHGVGKSALTVRYLTRRFIGEYRSQVDIIYRQTLLVDGVKVNLEIVDISTRPGEESAVPRLEICQCDGYLVVYSVADRATFLAACRLLNAIFTLKPKPPTPPITLLGNKQDLEHCRQVTVEEGRVTSSVFGCVFAEVSVAEASDNIAPIFTSLIRRAQTCLCPRPPPLLHPGSCTDILQLTGNACRSHAEIPNVITDSGFINNKARNMQVNEAVEACPMCQKEKINKRNKNRYKQQAVRSYSSPPPVSDGLNNDECRRNKENHNLSLNVPLKTPPESEEDEILPSSSKALEGPEVETRKASQQPGLCRSFSFPDEWNVFRSMSEQPSDHTKEKNRDEEVKNIVTCLTAREARLLKLSRAGSMVERTNRSDSGAECYCQSRRHTKSFKSSGKLEIVNIRKPEMKFRGSNLSGSRYGDNRSASPRIQEKFSSKSFTAKSLRLDTNNHDEPHSPVFLQTSSKTTRSSRKFLFDPLDVRSGEDGLASPTNNRQRKFSVFGRALGSFLSKGSLPDLPRATANICDKFGSLKKTIKKRSV